MKEVKNNTYAATATKKLFNVLIGKQTYETKSEKK
jgi:hypothetical protein